MKEMIYQQDRKPYEILHDSNFSGWHYVIVSYGTHPCAYVEIPPEHAFYDCDDYDCIPFDCHGDLTFADFVNEFGGGFYIGWDYAHGCDRYGLQSNLGNAKSWTIKELIDDVENTISRNFKVR